MLSLAPCRFLRERVQSQALTRSSSQRGNGHCAQDSHHHHAVDTLLSSVAPPPLRRLDQTKHHLAPAWDADRPFQEQVPTRGRKRPVASTTDHPASTGETACLYQDRPAAPSPADKNGADLETGVVHRSARDTAAVASPGLQTLLEGQVEGYFYQTKDLPGDRRLDSRDGKGQSTLGSRTDSW